MANQSSIQNNINPVGKKVIIIGAGPGGLAAGMLLSSKGYSVDIFEKQKQVGGRNSYFKLGEYTFDIGPTFLMMKDVLETIFEKCGKKLEDFVEVNRLDPMYRLKFADGRELYPSPDKEKMKQTMENFSRNSYSGYLKYLEKEKKKYDKLIPCLSIPYCKISDFFSRHLIAAVPYLDAHTSLYGVLSRYFDDPDTRIAFTFQAKYIGMSPWSAPGTFSIISYIEHGGGIYHVTGGLNKLSQAMAETFKQSGGKLHLNSAVKKLIVEKGTARGVLLDNGQVEKSDYVVINADFAQAMMDIVNPTDRKKWTNEKLAEKDYSCSTFMLYLGVKKEFKDIPHHSIIFAKDYKKNVDEITNEMIISRDFSFYIQNASVNDKTLAPEGKSTIYVLVPVRMILEGLFAVSLLYFFIVYHAYAKGHHIEREVRVSVTKKDMMKMFFSLVAGIAFIIVISHLIIELSLVLLERFNVSKMLIGLLFFSIGTNLPEIIVTIRSWKRNVEELSLSNILGSALANILIDRKSVV